jgi:nitrogen regulatory protein P-II 2
MRTVPLKLVTLVAETVLEAQLVPELRELGARGYTITPARGDGSSGVHAIDWEGQSVRIEVICTPEVAERILEHMWSEYFEHYQAIAYVQDVGVVRGEKYG